MKTGRSLTDLAVELERQMDTKADFAVDTRKIEMESASGPDKNHKGISHLRFLDTEQSLSLPSFAVTDHAHRQIAARIKIPQNYYDRMRAEAPGLLDESVRHWFNTNPETRMVRTLDGQARAFLSDRYRRIDNYDLMQTALPILAEVEDMQIVSAQVTDARLYVKAVFPRLESEIKVGDPVQSGLMFSNSEIGMGQMVVTPLLYRLICLNGCVVNDMGIKRRHVGSNIVKNGGGDIEEDGAVALYRDETIKADDQALMMKFADVIRATATEATFNKVVERFRQATEDKMQISPVKAVERLSNRFTLADGERYGVLRHLIEGGDLSRYGLMNAVTRASQDVESYDRATELEMLGGQVIQLARTEWAELAHAA